MHLRISASGAARVATIAGTILCVVGASARAADASGPVEPGRWAFHPPRDEFKPEALFDLRSLNEKIAGEAGFVRRSADGSDLVLGNGKPARFWALNTNAQRKHPNFAAPDLARHARFIAKRGVNLVRYFCDIPSAASLDAIDAEARDGLWRSVAAMKKEGIYTLLTPIWIGASRIKGKSSSLGFMDDGGNNGWGLLFIDPRLQEAYKGWMRKLLSEKNPYTGIPLAQDPALAFIQLQNEDSLLFWTAQGLKGEAKTALRRRFADFCKRKYGSLEKARAAWSADMPAANEDRPDDVAGGELALFNTWVLTQHSEAPGRKARTADQMEFLTRTMRDFNQMMTDFLHKELGCKQIVNAGNWRTADNVTMLDAERYAYAATEAMAVNRYWGGVHSGKNAGWAICNGDQITDPSVLQKPRALPITLKQVEGYPMLVTESSWVPPTSYQSEGPFLIAAYQSLSGVDAYFWFATGEEAWAEWGVDRANGYMPSQGKWLCNTPMLMGQWPAAALLYRMGYVKQGEPAVREERRLDDLWARGMPIIAEDEGYDPNRDEGLIAKESQVKNGVNPLAYQVGPVVVKYGGDPARSRVADLTRYIDDSRKTVRSITGELAWDYGHGVCTLNTPKAQGAAGFLKTVAPVKLANLEIRTGNDYVTVLAVALDDKPLAQSRKILVQAGTRQHATGWQTTPTQVDTGNRVFVDGETITSFGHSPWQIINADVTLVIRNGSVKTAHVLDVNGMAVRDVPLELASGVGTFQFPPDALYVVLQ